jgi:hypothetical protein
LVIKFNLIILKKAVNVHKGTQGRKYRGALKGGQGAAPLYFRLAGALLFKGEIITKIQK